jgi:hypothetical protein
VIETTLKVEWGFGGGVAQRFDITDRVTGVQVTTRLAVGDFGINQAIVTINNDDGAFTPSAGGTYSSVDWFSVYFGISGEVAAPSPATPKNFILFDGFVSGFQLQDDGVTSTVVMTADDGFTVGGAAVSSMVFGPPYGKTALAPFIEDLYNGVTIAGFPTNTVLSGVKMPTLGNSLSAVDMTSVGIGTGSFLLDSVDVDYPVRDFVRLNLMPQNPSVAWATKIEFGIPTTTYYGLECTNYPVRSSATALTFEFAENAASGELPFFNLVRGFDADGILNNAQLEGIPTGILSASSTNTTSADKYGTRTYAATAVVPTSTQARFDTAADRWANVFSASEFSVRSLDVSLSKINGAVPTSSSSADMWRDLLDIETAPVQVGTVEFTPTGGSSAIIETFTVMSRTIRATPADITVTVECLPIDQTGAFILDSSTLGVLDTNRLG